VKRRVVNRWWVVGVAAAIAAGACGGGDEGKDQPECEVGTEACPCYRDDTCNDGLECLSDLCVFDPDAPPPSGTGGRRGSGGNSSSPGIGGDGEVPVAGDGPGPGPGGTGSTPSGSGGSDPGSGAGGNSRGGSSNNGGQGNGGTPSNPSGPTPVERYGQLSVQGRNLVDSDGNPVKLEGLSSMWLNWEPTGFALNADALVWMRDNWNLRLFRIAMGAYHEDDTENTYLANPTQNKAWVNTIVQNAIDAGIYVIIDWHEHEALSHQAEAIAFFDEMSAKWGDSPNVIYEVFNEPLNLNWSSTLKPYHEAVVSAIRANDPDNVILLGTPNWDMDVDVAAQDPLSGSNLMYSLHFYACTHQASVRNKAKAAYDAGLPLFVSEWGATLADGGLEGEVCEAEARTWHAWLDEAMISWAAWKFDGCTDSTCVLKNRGVPLSGGWTAADLNGHGPLVIDLMKNGPTGSGTGGNGSGGSGNTGGKSSTGGSGSSTGGASDPGIDLEEKPAACAIVSTCPTCCVTAGVFALDGDDPPNDRTVEYTTAWSADASEASASFAFEASNEVGAIFFKFDALQVIGSLGVVAGNTGAPLEVALVKDNGASGCAYIEDSLGWLVNGCWGDYDDTFDQIEVRVHSTSSGNATVTVTDVVYE
jgi:aryl-phospho-beta-D-glucosidase BglC (GH1 family)